MGLDAGRLTPTSVCDDHGVNPMPKSLTVAALAGLLALAACSAPLLQNDASGGPGSNTPQASAVAGRAATGQFQ